MKAVDGSQSAFIVFSPDSTQVELFFSSGDKNEILDSAHSHPVDMLGT